MAILLDIVIPVFGLVLIGFLGARAGVMDDDAVRGLSKFVFTFAIPVLLFRTMADAALPEAVEWGFLLSYFGGALTAFALAMTMSGIVLRRSLDSQGVLGFGAAYSNAVLLGVPLVMTTFGQAAALPLFLLLTVHSPLLMTLLTCILEGSKGSRGDLRRLPAAVAAGIFGNPIVLGLAFGLVFNLVSLSIPEPIDRILAMLGQAATPCAVFAMGASLARYQVVGNLSAALVVVVLKTLVHPLLVWLLATLVFDLAPLWTAVAVVMSALPVGVNMHIFAERYGIEREAAAAAVVISTATSVVTVFALLSLLGVR